MSGIEDVKRLIDENNDTNTIEKHLKSMDFCAISELEFYALRQDKFEIANVIQKYFYDNISREELDRMNGVGVVTCSFCGKLLNDGEPVVRDCDCEKSANSKKLK